MNELTDADVMTAPPREMSDADVMKPATPAPAGPRPPIAAQEDYGPAYREIGAPQTIDSRDPDQQAAVQQSHIGRAWDAFIGEGRAAFGDAPLGMKPADVKWFQDNLGMFRKGTEETDPNPFRAFADGIFFNAAKPIDWFARQLTGFARGTGAGLHEVGGAALEAGVPRDIAGIIAGEYVPAGGSGIRAPKASAVFNQLRGAPRVRMLANARDLGVVGPERPPLAEMKPADAAAEAARPGVINAYHASPHEFDAFSVENIGTGEGAQTYGHGLYFAENPAVSGPRGEYTRAFAEEHGFANSYQVRIHADPDHMLDWFKPLNEQSEHVQNVLRKIMDESPERGWFASRGENLTGEEIYDALARTDTRLNDQVRASETLSDAGIPGIKYADRGSRPKSEKFSVQRVGEQFYVFDEMGGSKGPFATIEGARAQAQQSSTLTHNFVVFDDQHVEITHKNGMPVDPPMSGPTRAPARTMAAERAGDEVIRGPEPEQPNAWRERFDGFVSKIKTDTEAKNLITQAADANEEFPAARQGDIPLRQVEDLAGAAGVEPATVDRTGVGRLLQNDNQVRNAMQAMLTATEDVKAAAREVRQDGSPENLMKLQEAMLRRDTWVEQVVGHRAEWGRTGNVFQEFLQRSKEEGGFTQWLKDQDRSPDGLKKLADALDGLPPDQVPKFLSDANKPTFWDQAMWYWVNSLISGPVTHAKYVVANATFAGYEAGVVTPVAGAIGAVRRGLQGGREGVFAGEGGARLWGIVAGVPDALSAAVRAAKTGLQTPLPGEVAQGLTPKNNLNIAFQQRPIPGWFGAVIGVPTRGASAIHSFFNFLGYRASIEAQAYRAAAKDGLSLADDAFWQRRQQGANSPTPEMMTLANEEGYRLTYINELSPVAKKIGEAVRATKVGRLIMPFMHIPFNILSRAVEGTPMAFIPAETRADLKGANGAVKQDMATARLVVGSAVGAWAMNMVLNDRMSGFGPTDEKERAQWLASGHQPYSVRIGDYWYSFNRFGSLGTMLGLYSNLGEVMPHMQADSEEITKALAMTVHSTGRLLEDEVGMQGLAGLMDAINEPERKGTRFVASFAGSWLPYSSAQRQIASAMDPYMRETKTVVDGLRYYIPTERQGLLPKRDWLGQPLANAGYGFDIPGAPGTSAIIQHRAAEPSPLALEMKTLDLHPTHPEDRIGGVKLTPELFDRYQATAGPLKQLFLEHLMDLPNWHSMPVAVRQAAFEKGIAAANKAAAATMQVQYPALIEEGVRQRVDHITGAATTARPKKPPAALEGLQ